MNEALQTARVCCPYCGAAIELSVDTSAGAQHYVEDCSVCCRPLECRLRDGGAGSGLRLEVARDDE